MSFLPSLIGHISCNMQSRILVDRFTGSAVFTHDVTTGTGYCLIGFNWIIVLF